MPRLREVFFCKMFYTQDGILHPTEIIGAHDSLEKAIAGARKGFAEVPFKDPESTTADGLPRFTGRIEGGVDTVDIRIIRRSIPKATTAPTVKDANNEHPTLYLLKFNHEKHDPNHQHHENADDDGASEDSDAEYFPTVIGDVYIDVATVNEAARKKAAELAPREELTSYNEYFTDAGTVHIHATTKAGDEYDIIVREIPDDAW